MLKQVRTITNSLQMVEVSEGILPVISVRVIRHAADPIDKDSFYLEVTARGKATEGGTCHLCFTHKSVLKHGKMKSHECQMAARVLMAGNIDLKHWTYYL